MNTQNCALRHAGIVSALLILALSGLHAGAQETKKSTIRGTGLGALIGQAVGHDTESTLIGGAIGAGIGHVIGSEKDKQKAAELSAQTQGEEYRHTEVDVLGDTQWKLESLSPKDAAPEEYVSKTFDFRSDGYVVTTTTDKEGNVATSKESYRVVEDTLIVNKPGYLINARFQIDGDQLIVRAEEFSAVLSRLRPE